MITTAGKTECAKLFGGAASDAWAYLALGTGTTAAAITDTTLETEVYRSAAVVNLVSVLYPEDTLLFIGDETATGSATITEVGILNAEEDGDLLARTVLTKSKAVVEDSRIITLYYVTIKYGGTRNGSGW